MFGIAITASANPGIPEIWLYRNVLRPPLPAELTNRLMWVPHWWWYRDPRLSGYEQLR